MAKQIIILDVERGPGGDTAIRAALWFAIPLARRVPRPGVASAYRDATGPEIADIQSGAVIEEVYSTQYPPGYTQNQIKAALVTAYDLRAAVIAARPNPNQFFGVFYDGTTWSA